MGLADHTDHYTDQNGFNWRNEAGEALEIYFLMAFTMECSLKIIAVGLCMDPGSYLRDGWNVLDFTVVISGLATSVAGRDSPLTFLRIFRVLRPLRSISALPGMRTLVNSVLASLPRLANVFGMGVFLLMIFGIMGIQFWGGVVHRRCRLTPDPIIFGVCADVPELDDF